MGIAPENLPDQGFEYWASGPVCLVFHGSFWPDVYMVHIGVKPEAWGHTVEPTREILRAFWAAKNPQRVICWINAKNRQVLRFSRRLGFSEDGRMILEGAEVIMQGVKKCQ